MTRMITLDPGSPEWAAHQGIDSFALALSRSLSNHSHNDDPILRCTHSGLTFMLERLLHTHLFDKEDVDALLQRSIGMCALIIDVMIKEFAYDPNEPPPRYDTLAMRSLNDLHQIYQSLSRLAIERNLRQLHSPAHHTTKESKT